MNTVLLEARAFRPFKSSEEYLFAMKEDLAEWLQTLYPSLCITAENFMEVLENGVPLCVHANAVKQQAADYVEKKLSKLNMSKSVSGTLMQAQKLINIPDVKYFSTAKPQTFFARDNVSNFIHWCRNSLGIMDCLLFESDDLIMRKNEKHVILCLLEVARRALKFGMLAPMLVQMERQIDREIAADQKKLGLGDGGLQDGAGLEDDYSDMEDEEPVLMYGPVPQIVTNDLKSLDEMVRDLLEQCTCPTQFPMIRVSEGKYRIGDTKVLIFVRILRNHVMVRVGGGWDTLSHYLDKHDPCRCRSQHRTTQGARLVNRPGAPDLHGSHVYYDRSAVPAAQSAYSSGHSSSLGPPMNSLNRSRSRSPSHLGDRRSLSPNLPRRTLAPIAPGRSRSPTPNFTSTHQTRLSSSKSPKVTSPVHQSAKSQSQHISSIQIPIENKNLKSEALLQVNEDHSDTTSEVSDEGYRSLGAVQDKAKQRVSLHSQDSVEDADYSEHQIDETNDIGLRKTQFSQRIYENGPAKINKEPERKPREKSTDRIAPPTSREKSFERAASPKTSPSKKTTNSRYGTWNGRQKQSRPSLTPETFSPPLSRNCNTRRSVTPSPQERRHSSGNTSPTKGSFKQELINMLYRNDDEVKMAEQVQQLLKQYKPVLCDESPSNSKFSRNGDRASFRSPRKDSRPDNHLSRIPAPVL